MVSGCKGDLLGGVGMDIPRDIEDAALAVSKEPGTTLSYAGAKKVIEELLWKEHESGEELKYDTRSIAAEFIEFPDLQAAADYCGYPNFDINDEAARRQVARRLESENWLYIEFPDGRIIIPAY